MIILCYIWDYGRKRIRNKEKVQKVEQGINQLKFRCLIRKPRMVVAPRKKRRGLDVLAEA